MSKTTNHATAADFAPYVAEALAEGMADADVLVRYFKTARPGLTLRVHADAVAVYCERCEIEWGNLPAGEAGAYHVTVTSGYKLLTTETFDSLEYALAWIANQLAERCPVAALRAEEAQCVTTLIGDALPVLERETWLRVNMGRHAEAARLRRMFAIAEPGEVTT